MPHPADKSEPESTVPTPELNPLVNPLLGQNMGRWAEAYFTSPPERREQAVLELLRQLEAENSQRESAATAAPPGQEPAAETKDPPPLSIEEVRPELLRCPSCGHENQSRQKFCGMCGVALDLEPRVTAQPIETHAQREPAPRLQNRNSLLFPPETVNQTPDDTSDEAAPLETYRQMFSRARWDADAGRSGPPYRAYVGVILAILIVALAYMAWRSTQATAGSSHVVPPAAPAPSGQTPAQSTSAASESNQNASANTAASGEAEAQPNAARSSSGPASAAVIPPKFQAPVTSAVERNSQTLASAETSSYELAMAQSYLNGTNGREHNTSAAAEWLWKAVAKQNADATLLLADLYLRGDGVSKNCDQARVLLDAAATKGIKAAGEQLRHLQAFGCQ